MVKCIAHYRNQHIEHSDLCEGRRSNEQNPNQEGVSVILVILVDEVSEREKVLVEHHAYDLVVGVALEKVDVLGAVEVQHEQWKAEHKEASEIQNEEVVDLDDCHADQIDVEGGAVEEP